MGFFQLALPILGPLTLVIVLAVIILHLIRRSNAQNNLPDAKQPVLSGLSAIVSGSARGNLYGLIIFCALLIVTVLTILLRQ